MFISVKRYAYLAATMAAAAAIAGCGSAASKSNGGGAAGGGGGGSSKGPIVVGMSASETGADAVDGKASLEGNQYGVAAINQAGGLLGRKVKLTVIDDQSDATQAQQAYQKLITQDKVNFVIGPYSPDLAAAAGTVATRNKYVMLDPETALPIINGSKYAIQDEPGANIFMGGFPILAKQHGLKTIAILGINNAFGKACQGGQKAEAVKQGLNVVYTDSYAPTDNLSSAAQAIKTKGAQAVDVCSFFTDGVAATRALNQAGYRPKMLGVSIAPSEKTYNSSVGKLADKVISTTSWDPSLPTTGNAAFVKGFTAMFHHAPDYHAANGYQSMQVLFDAIKAAGSTSNAAVMSKLYSMTFHTVLGTGKINSNAVITGYPMYLYQNQGNKQPLIYPPNVAKAKVMVPYTGT